jgi:hypothetical protein
MLTDEHVQIATHEDHHGDYEHAEGKSGTGHDIHDEPHAYSTDHPGRRREPF